MSDLGHCAHCGAAWDERHERGECGVAAATSRILGLSDARETEVKRLTRQLAVAVAEHDRLRENFARLAEWAENYDGEVAGWMRDVLDGRDFPSSGGQ
jgi:hypothetical protein